MPSDDYYRYVDRYYVDFDELRRKVNLDLLDLKKLSVDLRGKILDLGCGAGALSKKIEEIFNPELIVLMDKLFYMSYLAKKNYENKLVINGDGKFLPLKSDYFDNVLFWSNPYVHFSIYDFEIILNEIYRVLKRGGKFITSILDMSFYYLLSKEEKMDIKEVDLFNSKALIEFESNGKILIEEFFIWNVSFFMKMVENKFKIVEKFCREFVCCFCLEKRD